MRTSDKKTNFSTIKFPRGFVSDTSSFSKKNGWRNSCEFIMAATEYVRRHSINLHEELPQFLRTTSEILLERMVEVTDTLCKFPERVDLLAQVVKLKADLSFSEKELEMSRKAIASWKKTLNDQRERTSRLVGEMNKQKADISRMSEASNTLAQILRSIAEKANDSVHQIEDDNSLLGKIGLDRKKLDIALETLKWVASEADQTP